MFHVKSFAWNFYFVYIENKLEKLGLSFWVYNIGRKKKKLHVYTLRTKQKSQTQREYKYDNNKLPKLLSGFHTSSMLIELFLNQPVLELLGKLWMHC